MSKHYFSLPGGGVAFRETSAKIDPDSIPDGWAEIDVDEYESKREAHVADALDASVARRAANDAKAKAIYDELKASPLGLALSDEAIRAIAKHKGD